MEEKSPKPKKVLPPPSLQVKAVTKNPGVSPSTREDLSRKKDVEMERTRKDLGVFRKENLVNLASVEKRLQGLLHKKVKELNDSIEGTRCKSHERMNEVMRILENLQWSIERRDVREEFARKDQEGDIRTKSCLVILKDSDNHAR